MRKIKEYLDGKRLFGDDFSYGEIRQWYEDEKEAYAELGSKNREEYTYVYHALNNYYGYSLLPQQSFSHVLGFGSAYGDEFLPFLKKIKDLTIIESSEHFKNVNLGIPVKYISPNISGVLNFPDGHFDLITSFGVLHHIPNVSTLIKEMARCTKKGGYLLIREPLVSMGDWRKKRKNLTTHERGIPLDIFRKIIRTNNLEIISEQKCIFPLISLLGSSLRIKTYNSPWLVKLDRIFSVLFSWNNRYHPASVFQKVRPTSVFYVLKKP